jgi:hypothetical protein
VHPTILPKQARKITSITYPHTGPLLSNPICVLRPDNVKYYYISFHVREIQVIQRHSEIPKKKKKSLPGAKI